MTTRNSKDYFTDAGFPYIEVTASNSGVTSAHVGFTGLSRFALTGGELRDFLREAVLLREELIKDGIISA